jgi:hypothetical protein
MLFNAALDVAIGIVMMFLVLSLLVTIVNELIATLTNLRAGTLKSAVAQIIGDPNLLARFYAHGSIVPLNANGHASYFSSNSFVDGLLGAVAGGGKLPTFAELQAAVQALNPSPVKDMLLAQLAKANGDLNALRQNVAAYFDDAMDRFGGIYKRKLKAISLLIGLLLAIALNADTIAVGKSLWSDAAMRAQMASAASALIAQGAPHPPAAVSVQDFTTKLQQADDQLRPLPLGWAAWPQTAFGAWAYKLIGLVLTGLALSLGAPFWFDVLSMVMNLRGTGPKPQRADS